MHIAEGPKSVRRIQDGRRLIAPAGRNPHQPIVTSSNAMSCFLLQAPALVSASNLGEKSSKKGLVIPSWPRHFCYDWDAFTTVRSGVLILKVF